MVTIPPTDTERNPTIKTTLVNGRSLSLEISGHLIGQTFSTSGDMLLIIHDITEDELWELADRMIEMAADLKKKEAKEATDD